jgi:hypothetical protein
MAVVTPREHERPHNTTLSAFVEIGALKCSAVQHQPLLGFPGSRCPVIGPMLTGAGTAGVTSKVIIRNNAYDNIEF